MPSDDPGLAALAHQVPPGRACPALLRSLPLPSDGEGLHRRRGQLRASPRARCSRRGGSRSTASRRARDRRQLALRKRQRDLVGLPLAAHQHLAAADGLQGLPDAGGLSGLPRPLQIAAYFDDYAERFGLRERIGFSTEVLERRAGGRGVGGDGRGAGGAARPSATGRCWSPTATTGTRAGPNRPSPAPRTSRASRCTSTTTASRTCCSASGCWCSGSATRPIDVAVESSRIAEKTFLAMRRGAWVLPKFLGGKPIDEAAPPIAASCRSPSSASSSTGC